MKQKQDNRPPSKLEALYPEGISLQKRMFSFMFSQTVPPLPSNDERNIYPEHTANWLSKTFFWWLNPMMIVGYKRTLQPEDLFILPKDMTVHEMTAQFMLKFENTYKKYKIKQDKKESTDNRIDNENNESIDLNKYLCAQSLLLVFWKPFLLSCIFMGLGSIGSTLNPLLSRSLINYVERKSLGVEYSRREGIGYAVGTAAILCLSGMLQNHSIQTSMIVGAKSKAVLTNAIIEKSFKLSHKSKHEYPSSKTTSMLGADLARKDLAIGYLLYY